MGVFLRVDGVLRRVDLIGMGHVLGGGDRSVDGCRIVGVKVVTQTGLMLSSMVREGRFDLVRADTTLHGSLDLRRAAFAIRRALFGPSQQGVQLESLLIEPLALFLEEVCVAYKHSSNLSQVLVFLISRLRAVSLDPRTGLEVFYGALDEALHIFLLQPIEHGVGGPVIIDDLQQRGGIPRIDSLAVGIYRLGDAGIDII